VFRPGDKVMYTKNDRELGLVNGDMGTVLTCSRDTVTIDFYDGKNRRTKTLSRDKKSKRVENVVMASVITCHKMQGDEAPEITVLLTKKFYRGLVHQSLLATAVTRAREKVRIIHDGCLNAVIKRKARPRKTRLVEFVERLL